MGCLTSNPDTAVMLLTALRRKLRSASTSASVGPGRAVMGSAAVAAASLSLMETGRGSSGREKWKTVMWSRLAALV